MVNGIEIMLEDKIVKKDYQVFVPEGEMKVFGRSEGCDVQIKTLKLINGCISRRHFGISCEKGEAYVFDEHSRNGTFLNEQRIGSREYPLREQDVVGIGVGYKHSYNLKVKTVVKKGE